MKYKLRKLIPVLLLMALVSCENQDWDFPDYAYSSIYFPYQTPVRTLVLGNYDLADNTKDNNLQFSIGVTMGGVYENTKDRLINYSLDETLTKDLYTDNGDTIVPLPAAYYTLNPVGTVTIPKGKFQGYIDVQLTDEFFNDPNSHLTKYVIPLKLTSANGDTILQGEALVPDPDPRVATDWTLVPKNYTLFGIKYINPYHGNYLLRGTDVTIDSNGTVVDKVTYHALYLEQNEIWLLNTISRNQVEATGPIRKTSGSKDDFKVVLTFSDNGDIVLTEAPGSSFPVTGTGQFVPDGDEFGGKKHDAIYLDFQVTDSTNNQIHRINDTLVIRDRTVHLETFNPVIIK